MNPRCDNISYLIEYNKITETILFLLCNCDVILLIVFVVTSELVFVLTSC